MADDLIPIHQARTGRVNLRVVGGVRSHVETDCVQCLQDMAAAAETGEVIGIAYAVMYRGRHYIVNTAGELHRNPTFARGAVAALDDELSRMAWGES